MPHDLGTHPRPEVDPPGNEIELEARYRAVFERSSAAIYIADLGTGRLLSANPAFTRVCGYSDEDLPELALADFVAHAPAEIRDNIETCLATGSLDLGVRRWRRKDGHIRFMDIFMTLVPHGKQQALCVIGHDVTDRIRAERQLEQDRSRLERQNRQLALLHAINQAISADLSLGDLVATLGRELGSLLPIHSVTVLKHADATNLCVEANWPDASSALVGKSVPAPESDSAFLLELTQPLILDRHLVEALAQVHRDIFDYGLRSLMFVPLFVKDRRYGILTLSSQAIGAFQPEAAALLELLAVQVGVALANIEAVRSLEDLARLKSEFVAIASHELRTPVAVARGYAKMLASPEFSLTEAERQTFSQRVCDAVERLGTLVEDLLDLSRLDDGKIELDLQPISVTEALGDVLPLLADRYPDRAPAARGKDTTVVADLVALERVLLNLLDNAFKYGPAGERPTIEWRPADAPGVLRIEVTNLGEPISADETGRLFQRFSRLPRHKGISGSGIGLFASQAAIRKMDGQMGVESQDGRVTFWFELPTAVPEAGEQQG